MSTRSFLAGPLLAAAVAAVPALAADKVQFFDLPEGARPHDVAPAPDGKVWYTAQRQGALGILDPASGQVEQVPLGQGSAPHGVIAGPDGAAWITDGGQNAIVSFDPASGKVSVHPLPTDADYANLNTAAFDGKGRIWFTGQAGIYTTREETIASFKALINGEMDRFPEQAFYMVGGREDVERRADEMEGRAA